LDLKAQTAEEISLSILSEIVKIRNGATGQAMKDIIQSADTNLQS
jgi:xanthine/CO dehydrogenase XdhC/CoxF family maturation factor